jgi:hypothetical protein
MMTVIGTTHLARVKMMMTGTADVATPVVVVKRAAGSEIPKATQRLHGVDGGIPITGIAAGSVIPRVIRKRHAGVGKAEPLLDQVVARTTMIAGQAGTTALAVIVMIAIAAAQGVMTTMIGAAAGPVERTMRIAATAGPVVRTTMIGAVLAVREAAITMTIVGAARAVQAGTMMMIGAIVVVPAAVMMTKIAVVPEAAPILDGVETQKVTLRPPDAGGKIGVNNHTGPLRKQRAISKEQHILWSLASRPGRYCRSQMGNTARSRSLGAL